MVRPRDQGLRPTIEGMTVLLLSASGLIGVLVGYVLFRPRRPKPPYFHPIANTIPPDLTPLASYGVSSVDACEGAERSMRLIREASN